MAEDTLTEGNKGPDLLDYSELTPDSAVVKDARSRRRRPSRVASEECRTTPLLARMTLFASAALLGLLAATRISGEMAASVRVLHDSPQGLPFEQDLYLKELSRFLPLQGTVARKGAATCIVKESFSGWSEAEQLKGAQAARSFLAARAFPSLMLRTPDGTVLAAARRGDSLRFFDPLLGGSDWEPEARGRWPSQPENPGRPSGRAVGLDFLTMALQARK